MTTLHEQARAEAEKRRYPERGTLRPAFVDGFLAGHEAASRTRDITTVAELDALPIGSVVLSEQGGVFETGTDDSWRETGFTWHPSSSDVTLPARVLHDPDETR